jgi:hypothetical protein
LPLPLPPFSEDGLLPPGDYELTLEELQHSSLVQGPFSAEEQAWRFQLVSNLSIIVDQLQAAGIREIYVDGSFATDKPLPGDIDVYFECTTREIASGELLRKLNELDPHQCWTWREEDRKPELVSGKKQLPIWWQYRVEAWPEYGQTSGQIHPLSGVPLTHAELFRVNKLGQPKGIIKLVVN